MNIVMKNNSPESNFWKYILAGIFIGAAIKIFAFDIFCARNFNGTFNS